MSTFNDRVWCHFCKRFVMDKLLRIHKSSDQHRINMEKCDPPPSLYVTPRKQKQFKGDDVIEIHSNSDDTIIISDDSRKPKYVQNIDQSSCFSQNPSFNDNTNSYFDINNSFSSCEFTSTSDNAAAASNTWSYISQTNDYNDTENEFLDSESNECAEEYRRDLIFPCGAWHYTQEFYNDCDWCNPKPR